MSLDNIQVGVFVNEISVEVSQIGRTGRVMYEAENGVGFIAELIETYPKDRKGKPIRSFKPRHRLVTMLSNCHMAALEKVGENTYRCHVCSSEFTMLATEYSFTLDVGFDMSQDRLAAGLAAGGLEQFDAVVLAGPFLDLVESVWEMVQRGERVRNVVGLKPRAGI